VACIRSRRIMLYLIRHGCISETPRVDRNAGGRPRVQAKVSRNGRQRPCSHTKPPQGGWGSPHTGRMPARFHRALCVSTAVDRRVLARRPIMGFQRCTHLTLSNYKIGGTHALCTSRGAADGGPGAPLFFRQQHAGGMGGSDAVTGNVTQC
jgi:hypothetical protein